MKAVGYIRTNPAAGTNAPVLPSAHEQREEIEEYCTNHSVELVQIFEATGPESYVDQPALQDAFAAEADAVVVVLPQVVTDMVVGALEMPNRQKDSRKELIITRYDKRISPDAPANINQQINPDSFLGVWHSARLDATI